MPEIRTVLTTVPYDDAHYARLLAALAPATVLRCRPDDAAGIARALETADVAILAGDLDDRYLQAPHIRWIHCDHAGLNHSVRPAVFERGILLTSSAGRSAPALAEHAMLFMLHFAFHFDAFLDAQRRHQWGVSGQDDFRCLNGKTVGIVGIGNTGRELALRAQAFGMRVLGYGRGVRTAPPPGFDAVYSQEGGDGLDRLLAESDYLVLAVPLTDETRGLIGQREFGLMKPGAVLVNMARGPVVDTAAMIEALRAGRLTGTGLDVFDQEPLPAGSPLWDLPNVRITPHTTPQVPDRTGRSLAIIEENIRRYRAGERLVNLQERWSLYTGE